MANNQQPRPLRREEQSTESFQTEMISRMYSIVEKEMTNQFKATNGKLAAMDARIAAMDNKIGAMDNKIGAMDNKIGILEGAHRSLQQEFKGVRRDLGTFMQKVDGMEGQIASILRILQSREG